MIKILELYIECFLLGLLNNSNLINNVPFFLKIYRNYRQKCQNMTVYLDKINFSLFLDWIPQIIDSTISENEFTYQILQKLTNQFAGVLSVYLKFYEHNLLVNQLVNENKGLLSDYFQLFDEIYENFYDPQLKMRHLLKNIRFSDRTQKFVLEESSMREMLQSPNQNFYFKKFKEQN